MAHVAGSFWERKIDEVIESFKAWYVSENEVSVPEAQIKEIICATVAQFAHILSESLNEISQLPNYFEGPEMLGRFLRISVVRLNEIVVVSSPYLVAISDIFSYTVPRVSFYLIPSEFIQEPHSILYIREDDEIKADLQCITTVPIPKDLWDYWHHNYCSPEDIS